ncbi:MAG: hypothetical protein IIA11_04490 [Proteobacteria bacterium]|nr:hypothetical protein [Pseudomonadota bacterium]
MRELTMQEIAYVAGGDGSCSADGNSGGGNTFGGISDVKSFADDMIAIYEGLVAVTSHIIERVANAF